MAIEIPSGAVGRDAARCPGIAGSLVAGEASSIETE